MARSAHSLQGFKVVQGLQNEGFARYLASRQAMFDHRLVWLGVAIYLATALSLLKEQGSLSFLLPVCLAGMSSWPVIIQHYSLDKYYHWRDRLWILHFFIHHVCVPPMLLWLGVDLKALLCATDHPLLLFVGLTLSSTVTWHCLNPLVYRLKFSNFCMAQPVLLALAAPFEMNICEWAAQQRPAAVTAAYGTIIDWANMLAVGVHPLAAAQRPTGALTSLTACLQVHLFYMIFWGLLAPGLLIWRLERATWRDFIALDVQQVMWPGGATEWELAPVLQELREKERELGGRVEAMDGRLWVVVALTAVILWETLDLLLH